MTRVSVILCTKDRPAELMRVLDSLAMQSRRPDEVIVVDASREPILPRIRDRLGRFAAYKYLHTTPSLTAQRNRGIDESTGDLIFFFDDDVILEANYLERMVHVFEQDTEQRYGGGMGQAILRPRRALWLHRLIARVFFLNEPGGNGCFKPSGFAAFPHGGQVFREIEVLNGYGMAYRRGVLERYRFDENLKGYAYMEDLDMSYRVSRRYVLFYQPEARLWHLASPVARDRQRAQSRMLVCNHHYLFKKNFSQKWPFRFAHAWSLLGLAVRAVVHRSSEALLGVLNGWWAVLCGLCVSQKGGEPGEQ